MASRYAAICFLAVAIAVPASVLAQQPANSVVTLVSQDKGLVGSKPVAAKDIVSHLAAQYPHRGLHLVTVQNCQKVPADAIQALIKDLQKSKFMPVLDFNPPDARLCAR